ncbi:hypothetical protein [Stutzerimonas stutzeri]|uniref:hypothetical protein n=1 Tax=Stutzerimonas stutzeri TaxID=316 RepID=UPI001BCC9020|nr:hypothetical protein [Stutzerimonas stutzeri]
MPLPWLIGVAVVAAAAAVVKAVSDDDSPTASDSGDAERRRQEREARLQRKRAGLAAKVVSLKKDRLAEANGLLALSAETIAHLPRTPVGLSTSDFENALKAKPQAISAYAGGLGAILCLAEHSQEEIPQQERDELPVNLQMLESLYGPIPFGDEEQQYLTALREFGGRLDRLQNLKQQLEQQG